MGNDFPKNKISLTILFSLLLLFSVVTTKISPPQTQAYPGYLHKELIFDAVAVLLHDGIWWDHPLGSVLADAFYEITSPYNDYLQQMYNAQDYYDSSWSLQVDHFWDPIRLHGLVTSSVINDGAAIHAERFFKNAISLYSTDKSSAYFNLGLALHLIQDTTVPQHTVSTLEEMATKHAEYEAYAYDVYSDSNISLPYSAIDYYPPPRDWEGKINPQGFVHTGARAARPHYQDVIANNYGSQAWHDAAAELLPLAIQLSASFLFYFWQYVNNYDFDFDGIPGQLEYNLGCDYLSNDTDSDLLTDYDEYYFHGTHPANPDGDNDGVFDGYEILIHNTDPNDSDSDDDSLPDGEEIYLGLDNSTTNPLYWDTDNDSLSDYFELLFGTDPNNQDTDADGYIDGYEAVTGTDPTGTSDLYTDIKYFHLGPPN